MAPAVRRADSDCWLPIDQRSHFGMSEDKAATLSGPSDLNSVRTNARLFAWLNVVAGILLLIASICFVGAMSLVAAGLIHSASL